MKTANHELSRASSPLQRVVNAMQSWKPRRAMTTAPRRAIRQEAANDPHVERALREVLAAHPELSSKTRA
jgi:hypothetical protein